MHWFTGRKFRYVTIRPRKKCYLDFVYPYNLGRERELRNEQECIDEMKRRAAGYSAQYYYAHRSARNIEELTARIHGMEPNNDHDVERFLEIGRLLDENFRSTVLPRQKGFYRWTGVWLESEMQIGELWPTVEAVTAKLMEFGTLSGTEVFDTADAVVLRLRHHVEPHAVRSAVPRLD